MQQQAVVKLVPDAKPRLAIAALRDLISAVERGTYSGSLELKREDVTGCLLRDDSTLFGRDVISPKGARLLRKMAEAGELPRKSKSPPNFEKLDAYIDKESALLEKASAAVEQETRLNYLAKHPDEARAEDVSRELVDRAFIAQRGLGSGGSMTIGGLQCHKTVRALYSNNGNRKVSHVLVWWIDSDGNRKGDPDVAPTLSRRQDPSRNWSLGKD